MLTPLVVLVGSTAKASVPAAGAVEPLHPAPSATSARKAQARPSTDLGGVLR